MPDHIHLLLIPVAKHHVSRIVATLKNAIRRGVHAVGIDIHWQWGYYDRILRSSDDTPGIAEYIAMNPVRKGLVKDYREWPFGGIVDRW